MGFLRATHRLLPALLLLFAVAAAAASAPLRSSTGGAAAFVAFTDTAGSSLESLAAETTSGQDRRPSRDSGEREAHRVDAPLQGNALRGQWTSGVTEWLGRGLPAVSDALSAASSSLSSWLSASSALVTSLLPSGAFADDWNARGERYGSWEKDREEMDEQGEEAEATPAVDTERVARGEGGKATGDGRKRKGGAGVTSRSSSSSKKEKARSKGKAKAKAARETVAAVIAALQAQGREAAKSGKLRGAEEGVVEEGDEMARGSKGGVEGGVAAEEGWVENSDYTLFVSALEALEIPELFTHSLEMGKKYTILAPRNSAFDRIPLIRQATPSSTSLATSDATSLPAASNVSFAGEDKQVEVEPETSSASLADGGSKADTAALWSAAATEEDHALFSVFNHFVVGRFSAEKLGRKRAGSILETEGDDLVVLTQRSHHQSRKGRAAAALQASAVQLAIAHYDARALAARLTDTLARDFQSLGADAEQTQETAAGPKRAIGLRVEAAEIVHPNLFNNKRVVVHGVDTLLMAPETDDKEHQGSALGR